MVNTSEFQSIRKQLETKDKSREFTISLSREIIRTSKQIIFALHQNKSKTADFHIKKIKLQLKKLPKKTFGTEISRVARQEYVEALAYYYYMKDKKLPSRRQLGVDTEPYLAGLCDLTGELVRKAVDLAINKKYQDVIHIKNLVSRLYYEFLQLELKGDLRKKFDAIKWNLNKIEDLLVYRR